VGAQQRRMRAMRPNRASSWNVTRTLRPRTTSGFNSAASISGSVFFSTPAGRLRRSLDAGCPAPLSASRSAPPNGTRPTGQRHVPPARPRPCVTRRAPPTLPSWPVLPRKSENPSLLPVSAERVCVHPTTGFSPCSLTHVPVGGRPPVAAPPWHAPLPAPSPSVPAWCPPQPAKARLGRNAVPAYLGPVRRRSAPWKPGPHLSFDVCSCPIFIPQLASS